MPPIPTSCNALHTTQTPRRIRIQIALWHNHNGGPPLPTNTSSPPSNILYTTRHHMEPGRTSQHNHLHPHRLQAQPYTLMLTHHTNPTIQEFYSISPPRLRTNIKGDHGCVGRVVAHMHINTLRPPTLQPSYASSRCRHPDRLPPTCLTTLTRRISNVPHKHPTP